MFQAALIECYALYCRLELALKADVTVTLLLKTYFALKILTLGKKQKVWYDKAAVCPPIPIEWRSPYWVYVILMELAQLMVAPL